MVTRRTENGERGEGSDKGVPCCIILYYTMLWYGMVD